MGRGSLDFAKNLVGMASASPQPPLVPSPEWCKCNQCRLMENESENVCCSRINCITKLNVFGNICLDRDVLEVCIKSRCDFRADDFDFSMENFQRQVIGST